MKTLALLAVVLALASGCARAHAKTALVSPPLAMPESPPRDVEPTDIEAPQPVPLPQEPAHTAPPRPRPAPAREAPKPEAPKPAEAAKPEPAPVEEPKPEEPTKPPTLLQTTPTTAEADLERTIRTLLARASADLTRVDTSRLTAGARTQYDTAKGFIRQADQAMRAKNLVFAKYLADKAAVLAAQLAPK
jgi:outer membrane biosynthesis protein TonB